jgi:2-hydroxycyclohexanecarboxyl-CoA dehydrogenase
MTTPRTALVTGGARGIGRGIAEALAASGLNVAIADLPGSDGAAAAQALANGTGAAFVEIDVIDSASVAAAVREAEETLGPIDVLVNNAGYDEIKPFIATDEDLWRRIVDVNYLGTMRVTKTVLPGMLERGFGRVISVGSDAARVGSSMEAVYSGSKGAIVSFSKALAREVAKQSVTVNVVCPGPTRTPGFAQAFAGQDAEKVQQALTRGVPLGRLGEPADVGAAVAFLASDAAGFITGQTLSVSGGLTMA